MSLFATVNAYKGVFKNVHKGTGYLNLAWGPKTTNVNYDYTYVCLDGEDADKDTVKSYQRKGKHVIAYMSAGSAEPWRADAKHFKGSMLMSDHKTWGETFINLKHWDRVKPIMSQRIQTFAAKGFDAVEFDNLHFVGNVPANINDNYNYGKWLCDETHKLGMACVLKNTNYLAHKFVHLYDALITEETAVYTSDVEDYKIFPKESKPWWNFEYTSKIRNKEVLKYATKVYISNHGKGWTPVNSN